MDEKFTENNFLAKWLNDELTDAEKTAFEKTGAFKEFERIANASKLFETPKFEKEKIFENIQNQIKENKQPKVRKLIPNWAYGVAASVAILIGVFFFGANETVYKTSFGEQLAVELPDGSTVELNAKSSISFDKDKWAAGKRKLLLNGEGYFKVEKGSKFTVETKKGNVSVLGTQFNVKTYGKYFNVKCFEGKVLVENKQINTVLTPGNGVSQIKGASPKNLAFASAAPDWITGETSYTQTPLSVVLKDLENHFNVRFDTSKVNTNRLYTGSFTHNNQVVALKTVFIPLQIEFRTNESGKVILSAKE